MVRTIIGGVVGGVILFVAGFIFWATPLGELPFHHADDTRSAAIQLALNQNLTPTGTGAYIIPSHSIAQGSIAYGQGPIKRRMTQLRGKIESGNSGGPVVDAAGRVVAARPRN